MIPRPIALHRSFQAVTIFLALCLRCCGLPVFLAPSSPTLMPSGPSYLLSVYHSGFPGSSLPFRTLFQALALGFFPSFGVTYCSPLGLLCQELRTSWKLWFLSPLDSVLAACSPVSVLPLCLLSTKSQAQVSSYSALSSRSTFRSAYYISSDFF